MYTVQKTSDDLMNYKLHQDIGEKSQALTEWNVVECSVVPS